MASIEKFEDIEAWQKARELTWEIYRITNRVYVVLDAEYITKDPFRQLYDLSQSPENLISGFIRYLQGSAHKGVKYS